MKQVIDLFSIFQHEKKRVGEDVKVYYNHEENSIQYKNKKGTLTVLFYPTDAIEEFYFQPEGEKIFENGKKLGLFVQKTSESGKDAHLFQSSLTGGLKIFEIPQEFINIVRDYQFNRKSIGLERTENI